MVIYKTTERWMPWGKKDFPSKKSAEYGVKTVKELMKIGHPDISAEIDAIKTKVEKGANGWRIYYLDFEK